jgi:hypothetical protein
VETWRSKAEDAREEVESLKLHLDTQHTEKPVSPWFGLVWFGLDLVWFGLEWCLVCVWFGMVQDGMAWYGMVSF